MLMRMMRAALAAERTVTIRADEVRRAVVPRSLHDGVF